jgi:glycosyltransferase involved in cell wall biosynthesis
MKLSILVPLYNEEGFVGTLLERVIAAPLPAGLDREIIVADDGSTDGSIAIVEAVAAKHPGLIRLLRTDRNGGKCSAIRRAIAEAQGEFSIVQDADLEYDPKEYERILAPLLDGRADAVFGSRFLVSGEHRVLYFWHSLANGMLTTMCNMVADLNLTDMETCYKAVRTPLLKSIPITSERFGLEPELTIKLAKREARIFEVPISYNGRTYEEGKKIGLKDAFEAFWVIVKFAVSNDIYVQKTKEALGSFPASPRVDRWMADIFRPQLGKHVLELGAGMGNLTRILASKRKRYIATDLDLVHLDRLRASRSGRPQLEVAALDVSRAEDFEPFRGQLDTVVCLDARKEKQAQGMLECMSTVLGDEGRAVVSVPAGDAFALLKKHMTEAGFQVESIVPFNRAFRPLEWFSRTILRRKTVGRFSMWAFDHLVWLFRRIDNRLPWAPMSFIVIARKSSAWAGAAHVRQGFNSGATSEAGSMQAAARVGQMKGF